MFEAYAQGRRSELGGELVRYTRLLKDMKTDLNDIFSRIRSELSRAHDPWAGGFFPPCCPLPRFFFFFSLSFVAPNHVYLRRPMVKLSKEG